MAKRGTLYRCHLCSFLFGDEGPQTPGLEMAWTQGLQPIGDTVVPSGTLVELYGRIEGSSQKLSPSSRIRFDILEEDFLLTGGLDDKIDSLVGSEASAADKGFQVLTRETEYVTLGENESVGGFLDYLRRDRSPDYHDRIFVLEEAGDNPVFHVLAFWEATRREDYAQSEYYFILNLDGETEDKSEVILNVSADPLQTPVAGAALEVRAPEAIEIDLSVLREAITAVDQEFASEQRAIDFGLAATRCGGNWRVRVRSGSGPGARSGRSTPRAQPPATAASAGAA